MSAAHKVRLEPVGEELTVEAGETVLDAAFRQGLNLAYGCREGQCSACKCFVLEGEATLRRYSNFALSDSERASGYSLMCRAMPDEDLVVELLHHDPENLRMEHAIADGQATVEAVQALTHDITRLMLRADPGFDFTPGQYLDVHIPDAPDGARRSFSLANLPGEGRIELIIKRYPGGRFSGLLEGSIGPEDRLTFTGPYGSLRLRESERPILMIAGGSGMAPILSLLRQLARDGCSRPVRFFYGARTADDVFATEEIAALGERIADFRFAPVTGRFVHEAVDEYLRERESTSPDVYLCGPPAMIEAAEEMLVDGTGSRRSGSTRIASRRAPTRAEWPRALHRSSGSTPRPPAPATTPSGSSPGSPPAPGERPSTKTSPSTPSRRSTAISPGAGRSPSRTAEAPGTTSRPRCAAAIGTRSGTRASSGSARTTSGRAPWRTRSREPSVRPPPRDCSTISSPDGSSSCGRISRCRRSWSTACGSRWPRSPATACRTP